MKEISMAHSPVTALVCKADCPPTQVRQLEARTPDGRYAASRSNELTLVRVRPRRNPTSALLAVNHGRRSMPDPVHKALGPQLVDAAYKFGRGFADTRASFAGAARSAARRSTFIGSPGYSAGTIAGAAAPTVAGTAIVHRLGRRKGRKDMANSLAPMTKSYRGDVFGKSADVVRVDRWNKPNPRIPDGARCGRRLPVE